MGSPTSLVQTEHLPHMSDEDMFLKFLTILKCNPERWNMILNACNRQRYYDECYGTLVEKCKTLEGQCEVLKMLVKRQCCSANINFSAVTIDELSDNSQVSLDQIVTGIGGNYVDTFPLAPGKKIRLTQVERPGWGPVDIRIDLNLSGGNVNYLDYSIQFFILSGDPKATGKEIGPLYTGNQFLNKDGTQIKLPFPKYKGEPIVIGSLETLAVDITNKGIAGNLDSVQVIIPFDNEKFYEMCRDSCKPVLSHYPTLPPSSTCS